MSDNAIANNNGSPVTFATKEVAGVHTPIMTLDAEALAALESVTIGGVVALDAPTLAALENINATTGGLTDTQLRATAVPVSGTVALDAPSLAALETITVANQLTDVASETTLSSINGKIPALVGGDIPVNDDALYSMIDTLNELVSRLSVLMSARAVDGTLRVSGTVAVGSIGTITTLTTLANQTSLGGYLASATVQQKTNQLVQLANISNVG